jgi:predicted transcriptional regulator
LDNKITDNLERTVEIVAAYVSKNPVPKNELSELIASVSSSLMRLSNQEKEEEAEKLVPAVSIKKSVTPDYIICLEDGRKFKSLKRPLMARYGLTPEEYRKKWGLPADYPMVAPNYAARRSALAKSMGLGRKVEKKEAPKGKRKKA